MKEEFIDNVLLRMYRQYSENEVIATFNKRVSDLKVEKGMLLSEIDELKDELKKVKSLQNKELESRIREHHIFKQYKQLMKNRRREIKKLREKNRKYAMTIYRLAKKLNEHNIEWQHLTRDI